MGAVSPRMTAPYQTDAEDCTSTFPIMDALGARKTSDEIMGFFNSMFIIWRCRLTDRLKMGLAHVRGLDIRYGDLIQTMFTYIAP